MSDQSASAGGNGGGVNVVVQQQVNMGGGGGGIPQNVDTWRSGICGCFEDCCTCVKGYFCMTCLLCEVSTKMGECPLLPHCIPNALVPMRTKLRTMYGIEGSIFCDFCVIAYCAPLAVCQMDRELKARGHGGL